MKNWKRNIRKWLIITTWCCIAASTIVLLVAAIDRKGEELCKGYQIVIEGPEDQFFINEADVVRILFGKAEIRDKPISGFDLMRMESKLEGNVWIRRAELFFDNNGVLRINVVEKEPIARVFTITGNSFYIDSGGSKLPLSDQVAAHLPVFTGFPSDKSRLIRNDSLLMREIVDLSSYINKSEFWSSQIVQVDITANRQFEMIPLIGNHVIIIGRGTEIDKKFKRLFLFYQQVLSKSGFQQYEKLDLQFARQIIATRKAGTVSKYDSLQAILKVKQMIAEAQMIQPDTLRQKQMKPIERSIITEESLRNYDLLPGDTTRRN